MTRTYPFCEHAEILIIRCSDPNLSIRMGFPVASRDSEDNVTYVTQGKSEWGSPTNGLFTFKTVLGPAVSKSNHIITCEVFLKMTGARELPRKD